MKRRVFLLLCILLVTLLVFNACSKTTTTTATLTTSSTPVTTISPSTTTTQSHWWDKFGEPQYGGTITVQLSSIRPNFDTYSFFPGDWHMVYEALIAQENWTVDRAEYAFNADFVPMKYFSGELAESWKMADPQTMIVNVRKGVHWQNKPPVNGREFTAYDVQHHYNRVLALGDGYTEPSVMYVQWLSLLESVKADDKYTVTVKFKKPGVVALWQFFDQVPMNLIEAPEYAALYQPTPTTPAGGPPEEGGGGPPPGGPPIFGAGGPLQDWHNIVGTGPWILSDFVPGTSETLTRNPDYWGYDERHPANKLPYANTLKALVIPDVATAISALRTGKIDIMGGTGGSSPISWQQAASLSKTNPELVQFSLPTGGGGLCPRVDKAPFNDIRVRKALNMAIDREGLAKGYYGSSTSGEPAGMLIPQYKGFAYPYSEWSQELKAGHSYNPSEAKKLLAEAGYPRGFKTHIIASSDSDLQLLQALKANLLDVGIDMEIRTMDPAAYMAFGTSRKHEQMSYGGGPSTFKPANIIYMFYSKDVNLNWSATNDPMYDALADRFNAALTEEEAAEAFKAADKYSLEQYWTVPLFPVNTFVVCQPYLKGYSGENVFWNRWYYYTARWWIDKNIKK